MFPHLQSSPVLSASLLLLILQVAPILARLVGPREEGNEEGEDGEEELAQGPEEDCCQVEAEVGDGESPWRVWSPDGGAQGARRRHGVGIAAGVLEDGRGCCGWWCWGGWREAAALLMK